MYRYRVYYSIGYMYVVFLFMLYNITTTTKNTPKYTITFFFFFFCTVCTSRDVRNSVSEFKQLKDCRIIEGFLMISLVDKYNETDYDGLEFPLLTEITGFLLLYRVNGLKSLLQLFPNLRIIRGNDLINDYSLIIYEMMHMQVSETHAGHKFRDSNSFHRRYFCRNAGNWSEIVNPNI